MKLGVEKIPARPCAGRDVGRGSVAAVVSLVTVSLETERADGNTLVSVLGGFGCLAFASIGWVGSGSVDGVDRGGGGCKGRGGEERRRGSRAREGGRECHDIRNRAYTICLEYKAGDSYVHAYVYVCINVCGHSDTTCTYVRTYTFVCTMYVHVQYCTYVPTYVCMYVITRTEQYSQSRKQCFFSLFPKCTVPCEALIASQCMHVRTYVQAFLSMLKCLTMV